MDLSEIKIKFISYLFLTIIFIPISSLSSDDVFFGVGVGPDGIGAARLAKKYDQGKLFDTSINKFAEIGINFWDGDTVNRDSKSSNFKRVFAAFFMKLGAFC